MLIPFFGQLRSPIWVGCSKCSYNSDISRGSFFPFFFFRISGTHQRNALKEETYFITYTQIEIPFNSHQKLSWPKRNGNKTDTMVFENHKKVSFNIASEASYVYILSGQKFTKNVKKVHLGEFWKSRGGGQTVLPDRTSNKNVATVFENHRKSLNQHWMLINLTFCKVQL